MNADEEKKKKIVLRVELDPKDDQPIYDYYIKIKEDNGLKSHAEVMRFIITKYYTNTYEPES